MELTVNPNARRFALERAGGRCEDCGNDESRLHAHHLHYDSFGFERPEDLRILCPSCHRKAHAENPNLRHPNSGPQQEPLKQLGGTPPPGFKGIYLRKDRIRELMLDRGIRTQGELAKHMGICQTQLSRNLNRNRGSMMLVDSFCRVLSCEVDDVSRHAP